MGTNDTTECRECGEPVEGGEGWDGMCGTCADREASRPRPTLVFHEHQAGELPITLSHGVLVF